MKLLIYIIQFISNKLIHLDYRLLRFKLFDLITKINFKYHLLDILLILLRYFFLFSHKNDNY